ncbi:MAG: type II toxin-antitoxin system HicA family toxin [Pirellulales bacterium]|nr:type II toxin-antitoxin system HicA family toxin [Pirellulales bacterium]
MNRNKLLKKLSAGNLSNVTFNDLVNLAKGFDFQLDRISGSHHIITHSAIPELLNLQEVNGKAKPYQIRQFLRLIERHNLRLESDE